MPKLSRRDALMSEPIVKPSWNNGRWGPKGSYFYRVKTGENWGSIATRDGWSDVKAFIRYNFQTDNPLEVNWFLKNFVGCKLLTEDGKNYRFSDAATPGYVFTRQNLQPSMQPNGDVPLPPPKVADDPIILHGTYGPPKTWIVLGGKVGGMVSTRGGDLLAILGLSLSGAPDMFYGYAHTSRQGYGLGGGVGFCAGLAFSIQHPFQLLDFQSVGYDVGISVGPKLGAAGKLLAESAGLYGMSSKIVSMVTSSVIHSSDSLNTFVSGLKGLGQSLLNIFGPRGVKSVVLLDVPFGGLGLELSAYEGTTTFRPVRSQVWGPDGLDDVIITW